MDELTNEKSIGAFLTSARKRIQPEMVGLKPTGRRRTAGLRREEVAEIANIGVSWYTLIEQGKDVHPSNQVLESIANALLLSSAEKRYLFSLAQYSEIVEISEEKLPTGVSAILSALDPNPAYVINQRWDFMDWNEAAEKIFNYAGFENLKQPHNLLNHFLLSDHMKNLIDHWEQRSKIMVSRYKADYLQFPQDAGFLKNIEFLKKESSLFEKEWSTSEIMVLKDSHKAWVHPDLGKVYFNEVILTPFESSNFKIVTFIADKETKAKIQNGE
ncbi:helix-turn-helix domain-containing protein [Enterococcus hulanensis]|uniref:helix-turn-helix transcriptional regulator n=1 Tax=Enterococcus hulanensis TaxID=2559929 RepID=UPI001A8C284B|nr:helix-turn-helix transcriptional regulator [Enterococcus hulanensis]MBO0457594.1 helix-turn-helix domain-containing protein [Enterococcus hulanensis]